MIARIWHGWTKPEHAKTYEELLRDEIFPSIAARKIEGYGGAELFVREDGNEVEFVTLLRFDSMDAVTEFAGPEANKPVIFPKAEALITNGASATLLRGNLNSCSRSCSKAKEEFESAKGSIKM